MNASMLLGALLVVVGVLASALADRIRGRRVERVGPRARVADRPPGRVERVGPRARVADRPPGRDRFAQASDADKKRGDQVALALMRSGWRPTIAKSATWLCGQSERLTLETWTRAALKNCALMDREAVGQ